MASEKVKTWLFIATFALLVVIPVYDFLRRHTISPLGILMLVVAIPSLVFISIGGTWAHVPAKVKVASILVGAALGLAYVLITQR
jgi:hypothetical protein